MENSNLETFKAQAKGVNWSTEVTITDTEWKIQSDEPVEDGGLNSGPNPMQYLINNYSNGTEGNIERMRDFYETIKDNKR